MFELEMLAKDRQKIVKRSSKTHPMIGYRTKSFASIPRFKTEFCAELSGFQL